MGALVFMAGFWAVAGVLLAVMEGMPKGWKKAKRWWNDRQLWKENRREMRRCYR